MLRSACLAHGAERPLGERSAGGEGSSLAQRLRWAPVRRWARRRLSSPPLAPPHEGRRGAVPPAAFLPAHETKRAHLFLGKPSLPYGSPNVLTANGLKALSGRKAVLATKPRSARYGRALPPASSPFGAGSRLGLRCRRPQRTYSATQVARETPASSGFVPVIPGLRPLLGKEGPRESLASAIPSLLLTSCFSVEPRGVNFEVLCHSGDRSDPSERATCRLRTVPS
ncbi:uncharacterized protein LOC127475876 [Manacus candei]|uniref:uncharacterized protein LOC127475876 n=1 Tax=Manacus candei TaxID=415023 RepID=UPI0022260D82|nr:uncharacterized protein LOC127475876 [Manacus candei]